MAEYSCLECEEKEIQAVLDSKYSHDGSQGGPATTIRSSVSSECRTQEESVRHLETLHFPRKTRTAAATASVWPHIVGPQSRLEHVEGITLPARRTVSEQEVNMRPCGLVIPSGGS